MHGRGTGRAFILVFCGVLPIVTGQTELTFSGNLERVGNRSVSLKLTDGRVVDAILPKTASFNPTALAEKYAMGDEVEISCQRIPPVWEEATSRMQSLEVVSIRFRARPDPEKARRLAEVRPHEGLNLLKAAPSAAEEHRPDASVPGPPELRHAREVNLKRLTAMPNFVADETAKRFRSGPGSREFTPFDTVDSEIAFQGRRAVRSHIQRNGAPWNRPFDALPGYKWYEGFDTEIDPLFDLRCPTKIELQSHTKISGRPGIAYRFRSPVDGCFPFLYFDYERYNPARSGRFFVDEMSGDLLELDDRSDQFPAEFEFQARQEHVMWDYVRIGGTPHLLPIRADFAVAYRDGTRYRVEVAYRNHRHFESSSNVTFQ